MEWVDRESNGEEVAAKLHELRGIPFPLQSFMPFPFSLFIFLPISIIIDNLSSFPFIFFHLCFFISLFL